METVAQIRERARKQTAAFERAMKRLETPITELKKYYTVAVMYDWCDNQITTNYRTKAEALKAMAKEFKNQDEILVLVLNKNEQKEWGLDTEGVESKYTIFKI